MNYGEEITYWCLRLNGFFPITNFVVHRHRGADHSSEIDIIAIRLPHVYEYIGGQPDDWDSDFAGLINFGRPLGAICEVKTGAYLENNLFKESNLEYAIGRLGLVRREDIEAVAANLQNEPIVAWNDQIGIFKLLVSNESRDSRRYFSKELAELEEFIENRVRRYPAEKYGDRMFFSSELFQHLIHRINQRRQNRTA